VIKSILISLAVVFISGCSMVGSQSSKDAAMQKAESKLIPIKHKMFQTVDKEQATLVQKGKGKEHCAICGMNLVKFYKTSHVAVDSNEVVHQYCSIHCLAEHIAQGTQLKNPQVVDVTSLKLIPVQEAYYVVRSNVKGTMSRVSKYAFKSLDDAKAFQAKHGGKIVDFHSAWETAKEDFK